MSGKTEALSSGKRGAKKDQKQLVLKAENHASREDYEEELELMRDGIESLVMEGSENNPEWGITEGWFQQAIGGMFYVMGPLYISKESLVEFAKYQDADLYFTRESDAEVLRNAPRLVRWFSAFLYFIMLPSSVVVGLIWGPVQGASLLLASFGIPVLTIRIYNTRFNRGERNRDELMANKIQEALETNDSVLAIVGHAHADGVMDALPDDLDVDHHPTQSKGLTASGIWDFTVRGFQMISLLFFLYLAILWAVVNFVLPFI
ncbi:hypothetical protein SG26_19045 (plasmid) [Haloarcula sp. CBA1115]|uniref:hypothetical protein n=1 Tax=unclassified Haloarcula TaxID=2624677 RepID=UPI0005955303|nr:MULTISPECIES: hypothetical protein [unclassified Haloarcula]AJF27869.1 hypothetical protein SG26_19045 [Haloarcula sp. CBA1115]